MKFNNRLRIRCLIDSRVQAQQVTRCLLLTNTISLISKILEEKLFPRENDSFFTCMMTLSTCSLNEQGNRVQWKLGDKRGSPPNIKLLSTRKEKKHSIQYSLIESQQKAAICNTIKNNNYRY